MFDWAITVEWDACEENASVHTCLKPSAVDQQTNALMGKFWKFKTTLSHYIIPVFSRGCSSTYRTFTCDKDGQYIVKLPRCSPELKLGCSRDYAIKCLNQNYRSLNKKGGWEKFKAAVSEYAELQHAKRFLNLT